MTTQEQRIQSLEDLIRGHFGRVKITRGRERLNITYGAPSRYFELNKAHLDIIDDMEVIKLLEDNG